MSITDVANNEAFKNFIASPDGTMVVAYFTASWCGACKLIGPQLEQVVASSPAVKFVKVDVDKNPDIATSQEIYLLPTFVAYKRNNEVFRVEGSNLPILEARINEEVEGVEMLDETPRGLTDLSSYISEKDCECLNESVMHPLKNALSLGTEGHLQSDTDAQLIISITFKEPVRIHSFVIQGPPESGPKNIRLYKNQAKTLSFDEVKNIFSVQEFEMSPLDLEKGNAIKLRYVRFQNIKNIQIFVEDNQNATERTQINFLGFYGRAATSLSITEIAPTVTKVLDDNSAPHSMSEEPPAPSTPAEPSAPVVATVTASEPGPSQAAQNEKDKPVEKPTEKKDTKQEAKASDKSANKPSTKPATRPASNKPANSSDKPSNKPSDKPSSGKPT